MNLMYKLVELGERFNRPVPDATVIRRQAQTIKDAVKVRIQPVADYLYMETDQEKFHADAWVAIRASNRRVDGFKPPRARSSRR
jgi:hypothetical protein